MYKQKQGGNGLCGFGFIGFDEPRFRAPSRLIFCALSLLIGSGCSHRQTVTQPYPFWGEAVELPVSGNAARRQLQVLTPSSRSSMQACLLIVHGMNEHVGRYGDIARHFSGRLMVAGIDLTAHGMSNPVLARAHASVTSGAAGYDVGSAFLEQEQLDDLQPMRDDIKQALHYLAGRCRSSSKRQPLPIFILSHSLGSLAAASYLLQAKDDPAAARVEGIVFSGPAFSVTRVPGWRGWFQNPIVDFTFYSHEHFLNPQDEPIPLMLFNQFVALLTVPLQDGMIELLSMPGLRRVFSPAAPAWVKNYLTDSEEEKIRLLNDKYMIKRSLLSFVLGVEKEIIKFRERMQQFDKPYLLIYSEHDPITPAWGNIDFAAETRHLNRHNRVVLLADASHHEQLFSASPVKEQLLEIIDRWLEQRLTKR
jgi:alpha-beta hydrolase superfamily lysophospholipase